MTVSTKIALSVLLFASSLAFISCQSKFKAKCQVDSCQNSGKCSIQSNSLVCTCPKGFSGAKCEIDNNPCIDYPGYENFCTSNNSTCGGNFMFNNGRGLKMAFDTFCKKTCSTCKAECTATTCQNKGTCSLDATLAVGYKCTCPSGFTGTTCGTNVCQPSPCENGGACSVSGSASTGYTCACSSGFTGATCETNVCQPNPCQNSGSCSADATSSTGYGCTCPNGYSGVMCQNDVCQNSPCKNNGKCTVDSARSSGYSCSCPNGYNGATCETNVCLENPCQNGGRCLADPSQTTGFTCQCVDWFIGSLCERNDPTPTKLTVETLVVVDKAAIAIHQQFLNTTDDAILIPHMRLYFSNMFSEINQIYKNSLANDPELRIAIKLTNILFEKDETSWSYGAAVTPGPRAARRNGLFLSATDALAAYLKSIKSTLNFNYDLAVGVTGKDICEGDCVQAKSFSIMGVASWGGVCSEKNTVVIEMKSPNGQFYNVGTTAHEIGHCLGSTHDGEKNNCNKVGNVMASGQTQDQNYIENPRLRLFSSCSISNFKTFFLKNGVFNSSFECLRNVVDKVNVDKKTRLFNAEDECNSQYGQNTPFCKPAGQIYSQDDFCKFVEGPNSYYDLGGVDACGSQFMCKNPASNTGASLLMPLEGDGCFLNTYESSDTSIGKVCKKGVCTLSQDQPANTCSLGDIKLSPSLQVAIGNGVISKSDIDCNMYLDAIYSANKTNLCYSHDLLKYCCNACQKYNPITSSSCRDKPRYESYCAKEAASMCGKNFNNPSAGMAWDDACKKSCNKCQAPSLPLTCQANTCQNGGTCVADSTYRTIGFRCVCPKGFFGDLCERASACQCNDGQRLVIFGTGGFGCTCV